MEPEKINCIDKHFSEQHEIHMSEDEKHTADNDIKMSTSQLKSSKQSAEDLLL